MPKDEKVHWMHLRWGKRAGYCSTPSCFQKVLMVGLSCKQLLLSVVQPQFLPWLEKGDADAVRNVSIKEKVELHNVWKDEWWRPDLSGCLFGELENSSSCSYMNLECPSEGSFGRQYN